MGDESQEEKAISEGQRVMGLGKASMSGKDLEGGNLETRRK